MQQSSTNKRVPANARQCPTQQTRACQPTHGIAPHNKQTHAILRTAVLHTTNKRMSAYARQCSTQQTNACQPTHGSAPHNKQTHASLRTAVPHTTNKRMSAYARQCPTQQTNACQHTHGSVPKLAISQRRIPKLHTSDADEKTPSSKHSGASHLMGRGAEPCIR
jgi:hypothetical protein